MRSIYFLVILLSILTAAGASAQQCAIAFANSLVSKGTIDYRSSDYDFLFHVLCHESGTRKVSKVDSHVSLMARQIGIEIGSSATESADQHLKFCSEYSLTRARQSSWYSEQEKANVGAMQQFNQCIALESERVRINHQTTANLDSVSIRVDFDADKKNVRLQNVKYNGGICTLSGLESENRKLRSTGLSAEIAAVRPFSITCQRASSQTQGGIRRYEAFDLTLDTNHGPYQVSMPVEGIGRYDQVVRNRKRIEKLTHELNNSKAELEALKRRLEGSTVKLITLIKSDSFGYGESWQRIGCDDDWRMKARPLCPGKVSDPAYFSAPGGRCGVTHITFACS